MPNPVTAYMPDTATGPEALIDLYARLWAYSEWRRVAAEKYPDDDRQGDAASLADDLVSSLPKVPDHLALRLAERLDYDPQFDEDLQAAVKELGFTRFPMTATAFLIDLLGVE